MSGEGKWEEFRSRAVRAAEKFGARDDAEDIAHAALLRWLEGYGRGQTVSQAVIDAQRNLTGRSKLIDILSYVDESLSSADLNPNEYWQMKKQVEKTATFQNHQMDFDLIVNGLSSRDRAAVKLKYEWGFEATEIADLFGVTKSRISHLFKRIEDQLRERFLDNL